MKISIIRFICVLVFLLPTSVALGWDLDISPEFVIASELTPVTSDTLNPGKPGMGFDGTNYLVVTCREDILSDNILGVLVSGEGTIVTTFPIADLNPVYGCSGQRPSVSFDGINYLVVFTQVTPTGSSDVVGVRVTPAGNVLDGPSGFAILSDVADAADVAFDGSNYLVVSARYNFDTLHDIIAARVSTDGEVLNEFQIFSAPGGQVFSSVAFDGNNYLVIWSDTRSGSPVGPDADIFGTRVSPAGIVLDPGGIPISTALGIQVWPDIIFDGDNYFVVWEDTRNGPDEFPPVQDIYGARITPDGVLLDGAPDTGGIAVSTHPRPKQHPITIFNGEDYFVAWDMSFFLDPPEGIFAARVSTDGLLIDGPPEAGGILLSQPDITGDRQVWPNGAYNGESILVAWLNNTGLSGTSKDIAGVLLAPSSEQLSVQIDILPGNEANPVKPGSKGKLKVAVITTDDFDASTINVESVHFGIGLAQPISNRLQDIDSDGDWDLVLKFVTEDVGVLCGDSEATLTGSTTIGELFTGSDTLKTVGCK